MGGEYDHLTTGGGGGLKLKGVGVGGIKKKKAQKHGQGADDQKAMAALQAIQQQRPQKTPAELAFEEAQRKRQEQRVLQLAAKSHKQRVEELNKRLELQSEHHDIPKIGPG